MFTVPFRGRLAYHAITIFMSSTSKLSKSKARSCFGSTRLRLFDSATDLLSLLGPPSVVRTPVYC